MLGLHVYRDDGRGVDKGFSRHSSNWHQYFHLPSLKTTGHKHRKSEREKTLARLASWFVFLLANPEFHSHLASWRVVI
jgi:hypothetical protein